MIVALRNLIDFENFTRGIEVDILIVGKEAKAGDVLH
jgi:hypothetical protein